MWRSIAGTKNSYYHRRRDVSSHGQITKDLRSSFLSRMTKRSTYVIMMACAMYCMTFVYTIKALALQDNLRGVTNNEVAKEYDKSAMTSSMHAGHLSKDKKEKDVWFGESIEIDERNNDVASIGSKRNSARIRSSSSKRSQLDEARSRRLELQSQRRNKLSIKSPPSTNNIAVKTTGSSLAASMNVDEKRRDRSDRNTASASEAKTPVRSNSATSSSGDKMPTPKPPTPKQGPMSPSALAQLVRSTSSKRIPSSSSAEVTKLKEKIRALMEQLNGKELALSKQALRIEVLASTEHKLRSKINSLTEELYRKDEDEKKLHHYLRKAEETARDAKLSAQVAQAAKKSPEQNAEEVVNTREEKYLTDKEEKDLWFGEAIETDKRKDGKKHVAIHTLEVAVAYCKADLNWINKDILDERKLQRSGITKVILTILSKCDNEKNVPNFADNPLVSEVKIVPLPNVGGCDYAYATFINDYVSEHTMDDAESSTILFIKDTPRTMENFHFGHHSDYRDIGEIFRIATSGKFICGIKPDCLTTTYHNTEVLLHFSLSQYTRISELVKGEKVAPTEDFNIHGYENLRDFHNRALGWTFPKKMMTPVCYGGTFAVPASRLISLSKQAATKTVMERMEDALSRNSIGSTLEEHFAERTWAGLFSISLAKHQIRGLRALTKKSYRYTRSEGDKVSVFGAFVAEKSQCS